MKYQLADIDPADLMPTGLAGCFPELYECASCGIQARVTEHQAAVEAGDTDLNAGYRTVFARGWRSVVPHGVLCTSCVDACMQAEDDSYPNLFS
jgi:hypothetical protein